MSNYLACDISPLAKPQKTTKIIHMQIAWNTSANCMYRKSAMSTTPTVAPKTVPERGHARIDHIFVLLATAVVLGGLGFAAYFALSINQSIGKADQIAVSGHGDIATILGIVLSLALGTLLTVIFVRGRRREAEEDAPPAAVTSLLSIVTAGCPVVLMSGIAVIPGGAQRRPGIQGKRRTRLRHFLPWTPPSPGRRLALLRTAIINSAKPTAPHTSPA
jgi:hypothetical protein